MTNRFSDGNSPESVDREVLHKLKDDMQEDFQEVIDAFLESIDDMLANLLHRSENEDAETICRWAHTIKSSAASIGMMRLSAIAERLEKGLKQGLAPNVNFLVSEIEHEYNCSRELIKVR